VEPDLAQFDLIHPCGLQGVRMTSIARRLGTAAPAFGTVRTRVAERLAAALGHERLDWADPAEVSRIEERAGGVRPATLPFPQTFTRAAIQETGT